MWQSSHSSRTFSGRSPLRSWCKALPLPLGPKGLPQRSQRLGRSLSTRRLRRLWLAWSRSGDHDCFVLLGGGCWGQWPPGGYGVAQRVHVFQSRTIGFGT